MTEQSGRERNKMRCDIANVASESNVATSGSLSGSIGY